MAFEPSSLQFGYHAVGRVATAEVIDRDVSTSLCQTQEGDGSADPLGAAGHQRDFFLSDSAIHPP